MIVNAASIADLLILTFEPLSPVALVNILTVFPEPEVLNVAFVVAPAEFTKVEANKLTPLNLRLPMFANRKAKEIHSDLMRLIRLPI